MTDPRPRLTMATALPGTRVVCVEPDVFVGEAPISPGETHTIARGKHDRIYLDGVAGYGLIHSCFVLATEPALPEGWSCGCGAKGSCACAMAAAQKPALPAMTPELVAALREAHERLSCNSGPPGCLTDRIMRAIAACPGLLAPPPATTDATFWLGEGA